MRGRLSNRRISIQEHYLSGHSGLLSQRLGPLGAIIHTIAEGIYDNPGNLNEIDFERVAMYTTGSKTIFYGN